MLPFLFLTLHQHFEGHAVIRVRGCPNAPADHDGYMRLPSATLSQSVHQLHRACSYFDGRRRKMQMTVKGRFLTPNVCFDSVLTGEGPPSPFSTARILYRTSQLMPSALDLPLVGIGRMMTLVIRGVLGVVNRIMPALSYNFHSSKPCVSQLSLASSASPPPLHLTQNICHNFPLISPPLQLRTRPHDGCRPGNPHPALLPRSR